VSIFPDPMYGYGSWVIEPYLVYKMPFARPWRGKWQGEWHRKCCDVIKCVLSVKRGGSTGTRLREET